jgi:hypothetical protein
MERNGMEQYCSKKYYSSMEWNWRGGGRRTSHSYRTESMVAILTTGTYSSPLHTVRVWEHEHIMYSRKKNTTTVYSLLLLGRTYE